MEKITKLSELQIGDLIQTREDVLYIYMGQHTTYKIFVRDKSDGWLSDMYLTEKMLHKNESTFDIIKVYRSDAYNTFLSFNFEDRILIFDREANKRLWQKPLKRNNLMIILDLCWMGLKLLFFLGRFVIGEMSRVLSKHEFLSKPNKL